MKNGAFVVILRNNMREVFLVKRSDRKYWELTGGGIEPGESVVEAVKREAFEETGFRLTELSRLVARYTNHKDDFRNESFLFVGSVAPNSVYVPEFPGNKGAWFPVWSLPLVRLITVVRILDALLFPIDGKLVVRNLVRD